MKTLKEYQEKTNCGTCFYCNQKAFKKGEPCCTYPESIDPFIKENKCEKHKDKTEVVK
jgi:hypothetical protein